MATDLSYTCQYIGSAQKQRLRDYLARDAEIPPAVIEFALFAEGDMIRTGANRNVIQLWTAGQATLSVDDDTVCTTLVAPCAGPSGGVSLGGNGNPAEFWFFADHRAALEAAQHAEFDVLGRHEEFLGKPLNMLRRDAAENAPPDLRSACGHMLRSASSDRGRILVTSNGCVGDSGMSSTAGLCRHRGRGTRQRLTASESVYRIALQNRIVIAQSSTATICHGPPFSTMFAGLDNHYLLPPFLPICRNQDGVFAYCVQRCLPDAYFAYLPWSLAHQPPDTHKRAVRAVTDLRLSDVVISLASAWTMPSGDRPSEQRLQSLGAYLSETTLSAPRDFHEVLRMAACTRASHLIRRIEFLLDEFEHSPSYWASDMQKDIAALGQAAADPGFGLPSDLGEGDEQEILVRTQDVIGQFGELLYWWPAMFNRAQAFHAVVGNIRADAK